MPYKSFLAQNPEKLPTEVLTAIRAENIEAQESTLKELKDYLADLKYGKIESKLHAIRIFSKQSKTYIPELELLWKKIEQFCLKNARIVYLKKDFVRTEHRRKEMDLTFATQVVDAGMTLSCKIVKRVYEENIDLITEDIDFFTEFPRALGLGEYSIKRLKKTLDDKKNIKLTTDEAKEYCRINAVLYQKQLQLPTKVVGTGLIHIVFAPKSSAKAPEPDLPLDIEDMGYYSEPESPVDDLSHENNSQFIF